MRKLTPVLTGLVSAAGALAVAELVAAWLNPTSSPVLAVGAAIIDATPRWLKEFAVQTFGTADKAVLLTVIYLSLAAYAGALGVLAVRRPSLGLVGVALFGVVGVAAVLGRPTAGPADVLPTVAGTLAGIWLLLSLAKRARDLADSDREFAEYAREQGKREGRVPGQRALAAEHRRSFLLLGAVAAGALVVGGGARLWAVARSVGTRSREAVRLPPSTLPVPDGVDLKLPELSSFYTDNRDFYRIDTALSVPQVDAATWKLKIHGMVDRPRTVTFDELRAMPAMERDITLNCVSNEVGGPYIGTARWLGVSLGALLREVGIRGGADQVVSRSTDGWTCGTPVATLLDGRDAMLVYGMNGQPLPIEHGFPVRVIVPGLYGYVSACKWLAEMEVTTFAEFDAYWVRRGWSAQAPVKTASRIDTPTRRAKAGPVSVAGVAWAQHRGISKVEVQVDDAPWQEARLAAEPSADTWRQWVHVWDATPGSHRLRVRATDGTGATQTGEERGVVPDGATGWHEVTVSVE
ncbi:oxidoreductase [Longispora fulva]|uniref:DMSO/TMAO reductase YedYZ molybdopterin-dependent catalytic subunit n=1 Tax=Longispora fulva TaxID=619741 RepID=A0A8J7GN62_9ACTN|nr:molybdopterin-dependent oxidoreductase [Longispora fulva]MBG6140033.1 DMSO/TMAO reductase YedYZ molybdopterin-dependent catalytic subunit [Longispora fulva]GIG57589.1 oxidoreductase [Longispora fulva]